MKYNCSIDDPSTQYEIAENELKAVYLSVMAENPKTTDISQSLYLTILAIKVLDYLGQEMPSQSEIDSVERRLRLYVKNNAK